MPKAQDAANWTNPTLFKRAASDMGPLVSTVVGKRDGSRPVDEPAPQGEIFSEPFDDQPDFTATMHSTSRDRWLERGDILPSGWTHLYQDTEWAPETGYPNNHASLEILSANSDKARGGGKSAVFWRESYKPDGATKYFGSDAQLIKVLENDYNALYVEFYIRFSPNWYQRGDNYGNWMSKVFRIEHFDRSTKPPFSGNEGGLGPILFWDYKRDLYGLANYTAYRGGPPGENYVNGSMPTYISSNFSSSTAGQAPGGTDPQVPDLVNGGYLVDKTGVITHEQVYGDSSVWTKIAFYVEMNSDANTADGIHRMWINDQRIVNRTDLQWFGPTDNPKPGWNLVAIGGNDYFQPYPNEDLFEDWYAIDDLTIRSDIPQELQP